jgi:phenylalanyl-tRNA synthetase beta chain
MKASYRWLCALVPGLDASPKDLAERLTRAGIEVEAIDEHGVGAGVVVAEVRALEPHPTRPKLRLVTVDRGGGVTQQIVCGAPNVPDPGGLVLLASIGTTIPGLGITLDRREIGGIVSEGMLCSERELGLAIAGKKEEDPGILVLPKGAAKAGTPLHEAVPGSHDFIFDISLTPNRPDCLGHVGLARELAALYGLPFTAPAPEAPARVGAPRIEELVTVTVEDSERCPIYGAAAVVDVTIGPSPAWLRYRLESLGIRSISNVVDVTNLVLLEFGQPMHAFDLDLVRGARIVVRRAKDGEPMRTLDGVERKLDSDDLVICDGEGPVALAGVMGGENSEIRPTTKRVLLECAYFTSRGVRRASRRHSIHSESSHRFERGTDPGVVPDVLAHAASLLTTLAGGAAAPGAILAGAPPHPRGPVRLRKQRMDALLGVDVPFDDALGILKRLGCSLHANAGEGGTATAEIGVPTHRPDLEREVDLIEEVLRVKGLDMVPTVLPAIRPTTDDGEGTTRARTAHAARELGLDEALLYGFVNAKDLAALGLPPSSVVLRNPLTEERSVMRTSLLPGLLEAASRAKRHAQADVRLYALGARFLGQDGAPDELPDEVPSFAALLSGSERGWLAKARDLDVYDAKGLAVELVQRVTRGAAEVRAQGAALRAPYLHPRGAADVLVDGVVVGCFGPLHPDVLERWDLGPTVIVELDLRALAKVGRGTPRFRPIPTLPASTRDIALVVAEAVPAGSVGDAIRGAAGELCESVELFDLFRGGAIPEGQRSLAFHVVYRDPRAATAPDSARTLTDQEVDERHAAVVREVNARFGAVIRGA